MQESSSNVRINHQQSTFHQTMAAKTHSIFDPAIIVPAIGESFKKLNPVTMLKNPVMFVTEVGAVVTTVLMFTGLRVRRSDFFCRLRSGFGSRSSSPILPRPWPRAGKSRPTLCGRRARRPSRTASRETASRKSRPSSCARKISLLSRRRSHPGRRRGHRGRRDRG